jgi:hypothetical protein
MRIASGADMEVSRSYVLKLMKSGAIKKYKTQIDKVIGSKIWSPALPGNPIYFIKQDLELISSQVLNYIKEYS